MGKGEETDINKDVYFKPHPDSLSPNDKILKSANVKLDDYGARFNDVTHVTDEEKRPFQDQSEGDKVRYTKDMDTYVPPPEPVQYPHHAKSSFPPPRLSPACISDFPAGLMQRPSSPAVHPA